MDILYKLYFILCILIKTVLLSKNKNSFSNKMYNNQSDDLVYKFVKWEYHISVSYQYQFFKSFILFIELELISHAICYFLFQSWFL